MDEPITFLCSIAPLQSGIQITGRNEGMRLKIDIPESEMAEALLLLQWRERVLRVTVEPDDGSTDKSRKLHI